MKLSVLFALICFSMVSTADEDRAKRLLEFKELNEKIVTLEKALRLQTLTTEAVRMDDYDLACKSQKEATLATHQANIKDIYRQSDIQFAEICSISRAVAETKPSWLQTIANKK